MADDGNQDDATGRDPAPSGPSTGGPVTESRAFLPVSVSSRRSRSASSATEAICSAIRSCTLLEFEYEGLHRVVAPYCHGFTGKGEALRAIQVRGASRSRGFGFGKLWLVEKM